MFRRILDEHGLAPGDVVFIDTMFQVMWTQPGPSVWREFTDASTLAQQLTAFDWRDAAHS